jgi:hypothetical protein
VKRIALVAVLWGLSAAVAQATVGGPVLAKVLGLDAGTQRAYFVLTPVDESGRGSELFYFDLAGATPARPVRVPIRSPRSGTGPDSALAAHLARLRPALVPLAEDDLVESFVLALSPQVWDSVRWEDGRKPRYVVTLYSRLDDDRSHPIRLTTLDTTARAVRELRRYRVPEGRRWIVIWSCESFAFEGGYEMQFPVLLGDWRGRPDPIGPEAYVAPE